LRKRTAAVRSEGGGVEVDGLRKRTAAARSEGGGVEVDGLKKGMVAARSEVGVEAAMCSGADDEAAACSGVRIEDGRWRWWHDGF
jgi:hypothetical protein